MDFDTDLAERDWTEALSIAKTLGDSPISVNLIKGIS